MKCDQESHRSLFLQCATCHLALVLRRNGGYRSQTDSLTRLCSAGPAITDPSAVSPPVFRGLATGEVQPQRQQGPAVGTTPRDLRRGS
jgi:hypothetical protein